MLAMYGHTSAEIKLPAFLGIECSYLHLKIQLVSVVQDESSMLLRASMAINRISLDGYVSAVPQGPTSKRAEPVVSASKLQTHV